VEALTHLGQRIRQARIARNLTLAELASRVFVTEKTLRRIESGDPGASLSLLVNTLFALGRLQDMDMLLADDRISAMQLRRRLPRRASSTTRATP
jgi:transcriptional regulator with XRE-family HTH domain